MPKKVVMLTIMLTFFGLFFTVLGLLDLLVDTKTDFQRGVALLVLGYINYFNKGIIMLIPGGYYSVHLYYYFRAASPIE